MDTVFLQNNVSSKNNRGKKLLHIVYMSVHVYKHPYTRVLENSNRHHRKYTTGMGKNARALLGPTEAETGCRKKWSF